jgi:hypothetical protein
VGLSGFLIAGAFMAGAIALAGRAPTGHRFPGYDDNVIVGLSCAIFFETIYFTGQLVYRMLGAKAELALVREVRRQHMSLLWLMVGCLVAGQPGKKAYHGIAMPQDWLLLAIGLLILAYSLHGIIIAVRSRVPFSWVMYGR